jgi:hypothetical protein
MLKSTPLDFLTRAAAVAAMPHGMVQVAAAQAWHNASVPQALAAIKPGMTPGNPEGNPNPHANPTPEKFKSNRYEHCP